MLFGERKFVLVTPDDSLEDKIKLNGGLIVSWKDRYGRETTPQLIIISDTIDFEYYDQLNAIMVPIVTPCWIMDCTQQQKVLPTRPYSPDPLHFMKSVNMSVAGLSEGDIEGFYAGIKVSGGDFSPFLTIYTTHLIATDLHHELCRTAIESGQDIKLVAPEWFDDCMKLGRKVDEGPYHLLEPKPSESSRALMGTYSIEDDDSVPRQAIANSIRHGLGSHVFTGKKFYLSEDLEISARMKKHIYYLVEVNDGEVVSDLEDANVYLARWRSGAQFTQAAQRRSIIGNLLWLYWMALHQTWELPTKHLLHFPEVRGGLEDMKDKVICITNYTGEARNYLRTLIQSIGARYTGTLCQSTNTHLIAAYSEGPKYEAAKSWGIKIVNHLWLEDSYSKWMLQDVNVPRYQYLPRRLDLTTLIGSTPLSTKVLRQFYKDQPPVVERHLPSRAARNKAQRGVHQSVLKENLFKKQLEERRRGEDDEQQDEPQNGNERQNNSDGQESQDESIPVGDPAVPTATLPKPAKATQKEPPEIDHVLEKHEPPKKKAKQETLRIVVTSTEVPYTKQKLADCGLKWVDGGNTDVLVAPKVLCTHKFLLGLAVADEIVGPAWVDACVQAGSIVDAADYRLPGSEEIFAKRNELDAGLFSGLKFKISPKVKGGPKTAESIVVAHGGRVVKRAAPDVLYVRGSIEDPPSGVTHAGVLKLDALLNSILTMDAGGLKLS